MRAHLTRLLSGLSVCLYAASLAVLIKTLMGGFSRLIGLAVCGFIAAVIIEGILHRSRSEGFIRVALILAITLIPGLSVIMVVYVMSIGIPKNIVLLSGAALSGLILLFVLLRSAPWMRLIAGCAVMAAVLPGMATPAQPQNVRSFIFSSYHDLRINYFPVGELASQDGGAIAYVGGNAGLVVVGNGTGYKFTLESGGIRIDATAIQAPLELETYLAEAPSTNPFFRVTDVLLDDTGGEGLDLYTTYTRWNKSGNCFTLALAMAQISRDLLKQTQVWKPLFESQPCIHHEGDPTPNTTGGRMALLDARTLLFTVGDFALGDYEPESVAQSQYGKVMAFDVTTGRSSVFTSGHRNPQGLLVTSGSIWLTEHGPFGGDELNKLIRGSDYGWPYSTYGTDYGKKVSAVTGKVGDHSRGTLPVFAWLPSIGISSLIEVKGTVFNNWQGDLLIGSLNGLGSGYSLYRTRVRDGRAITIERIRTGQPVRDLVEMADGRLLIWNGLSMLQLVEPAEGIFSSCGSCHNIRRNTHGIGPDLWGVVGSKVARHEDYRYSSAMVKFGGHWTRARLDQFLKDPKGTVPGTTMEFEGIANAAQRQEIIDYLDKVSVRPQ
jgi:cytochrome c2/glucose/arabinose dehydrogenase